MKSVIAQFATTVANGKIYQVERYNLDVISPAGDRVKYFRGTHFERGSQN